MNSSFLDFNYITIENKIFANFYEIEGVSSWGNNYVGYAGILDTRDFYV